MSSIEKVWSAFKVNPASEALYTDDVFVVYVPTSAGGRGLGDVVRFYSQQDFVPSVNVVKETIHKKILTEDAVVEEVEWSVTFTSGECCWLLPNLDKSHLVDATVIFPAVISASFSAGKIFSLRVYWDQASLLKQIKVIGERQRWPIRGIEQIDALRKPHMLQLNPFGRGSEARMVPSSSFGSSKNGEPPKKHPMSSNIFDAEPESQRLSSRVNQPGGTGGRSIIFDEDAPLPGHLPGQRRTTGKGILPGFDPDPVPARSPPRRTTGKSILPGFDDEEPAPQQRLSSRVNQPGGTGGRSRIFDDTPPNSPPRRTPAKSILPGFDSEEFSPTSPPSRPFAGKSNQSTVFDEQPVDMSSSISGSTRRANTANNQSHHEERAAAASADTNANDTLSPSISSTTTASDSSSRASRRQNAAKNDAHFSFSDEETGPTESLSASRRKYSSRGNTSSFSFAAEEVTTSLSGSTKGRSNVVFNESQLDKDTSNDGDYRQHITPSSRVLKAPGGNSSITFG